MTTRKPPLAFWIALGVLTCVAHETAHAGDARARADYMIHCQGCHVPDGSGLAGKVPDLRASLPLLLSVEGGRSFLVQVPGSSMSALSDARLAATLNWMVRNFTDLATDQKFNAYTEAEIENMRRLRLEDVLATRNALIEHLEPDNGRPTE